MTILQKENLLIATATRRTRNTIVIITLMKIIKGMMMIATTMMINGLLKYKKAIVQM